MIHSSLRGFEHPPIGSPIKENSSPSKSELTCEKVMGVFLIVSGVLFACAFVGCLTAAVILSSGPLAIAAAVVALVGLAVLLAAAVFYRSPDDFHIAYTNSNRGVNANHVRFRAPDNQGSSRRFQFGNFRASTQQFRGGGNAIPGSRNLRY